MKMKALISCFIIFIMINTFSFQDIDQRLDLLKNTIFEKLVEQVNRELGNLNTQFPPNIKNYIGKMHTKGQLVLDEYSVDETDNVLRNKHKMPETVIQKFKGIYLCCSS